MKAYQVTKFAAPIEMRELATPEPTGTEVLIKVQKAGVCHSDLHIHDGFYTLAGNSKLELGERGLKLPRTMGHELYGEVVSGGSDAGDLPIGEGRLIHPWMGCGECAVCQAGDENICIAPKSIGVFTDGAYADYCLIPHPRYLVDIGDLDPALATPYSCSGVTVYSALRKALPIGDDEWLVIMGAGGLGLNAIAIAKALEIKNILVCDLDDSKLEAAREMGADQTLNPGQDKALAQLSALTGGGPRAVVDTVGAEGTSQLGVASLQKGGRYVIVGLFGGGLTLALPTLPLRAISIIGSYTGNLAELKELIDLARSGKVKPLPVTSRPMEEVGNTLDDLRDGKIVGRVVLSN
ncbi:MAG: alcohol dehydrogenase catalytic domain-containing protein [Alphaproteobacteria bacterium]|nr:alcohol dehydrogenase catalytic domain-containing protein [Alphaproteobacteria bacterium]MBT4085706.1 alcohol dehydrogenase catalytic domain-containing protein [Alphaproteobacteria bacterium]MBT4543285.1 alcohol dehydrogenase catalytic domain-containing protein [Alphaproteobacteria bacterium]MBT7747226.1 alcohol dehydrogenase catalytic domain-containing protein [Alphaproteobacteria bacterium]